MGLADGGGALDARAAGRRREAQASRAPGESGKGPRILRPADARLSAMGERVPYPRVSFGPERDSREVAPCKP